MSFDELIWMEVSLCIYSWKILNVMVWTHRCVLFAILNPVNIWLVNEYTNTLVFNCLWHIFYWQIHNPVRYQCSFTFVFLGLCRVRCSLKPSLLRVKFCHFRVRIMLISRRQLENCSCSFRKFSLARHIGRLGRYECNAIIHKAFCQG